MLSAALATFPYFAINIAQVAIHDGSFIHFSKQEALKLTAVLGLVLWIGTTIILAICAWSAHGGRSLYCFAATAVFAILATAVDARFWVRLFDLLNNGFAEWIFRTGVTATVLSLLAWARAGGPSRVS
jgi:hypothetical protein